MTSPVAAALPPTASAPIAPKHYSGTIHPTYVWAINPAATWYQLQVVHRGGPVFRRWYTAEQAMCSTSSGTCRVTPALTLAQGVASWSIQTWNPAGEGPWTLPVAFDTALPVVEVLESRSVPNVYPGFPAQLWLHIRNAGTRPLPPGAEAWSLVQAGGFSAYSAPADVSEVAPNQTRWVLTPWEVPVGRSSTMHTYRGSVWFAGRWVANWTTDRTFAVLLSPATYARVVGTWQVDNVVPGSPARLWALVRNTGATPLTGTVWFNVHSIGWVGSAPIDALAPGAEAWYSFVWRVPANRSAGTHWYLAQVWNTVGSATISNTGDWQVFSVGLQSDFVNGFEGWSAGNVAHVTHDPSRQALVAIQPAIIEFLNGYPASYDLTAAVECSGTLHEYAVAIRNKTIIEWGPGGVATWYLWTRFRVTSQQEFDIRTKVGQSDSSILTHQPLTFSNAINPTGVNLLRVVVNNNAQQLYINGTRVWSGYDDRLHAGTIQLLLQPGAGGECVVHSVRAAGLHDPTAR